MPLDTDWFCSRLVQDGDARIALDPLTGLNSYGCGCRPDSSLLEYGSATASTVSAPGFAAAQALATRMAPWINQPFHQQRPHLQALTGQTCERLLPCLWGTADSSDPPCAPPILLLSASGTDALRQGAALCAIPGTRLAIFLLEAEESGRGVPRALATRVGSAVHHIPARDGAGQPYPVAMVDQALEEAVTRARQAGEQVLLVLTDVSKTGLISPSPSCIMHLQQRFGSALQVLVDACQLRLTRTTLRAYLAQGCLVALTGSKFMGGPSFSGALLLPARHTLPPEPLEQALQQHILAPGPLLRWTAALTDLEAFTRIPESLTYSFLAHFAQHIQRFMAQHPRLEPLPVRQPDRSALFAAARAHRPALGATLPEGDAQRLPPQTPPLWDQVQTIFPFLLHRTPPSSDHSSLLGPAEMLHLFHQLPKNTRPSAGDVPWAANAPASFPRGRLGQPVRCGARAGREISALRLCSSARLVLQSVIGESWENAGAAKSEHLLFEAGKDRWPDASRVQLAADRSAQQACQFLEHVLWQSAKC